MPAVSVDAMHDPIPGGAGAARPTVTVGVPVRNGLPLLRRALESVVAQTYAELSIVVSDNCSTDGTRELALEFAARDPRIRYVAQPRLLTVMEQFRFIVDQADTEYVLLAAHDDFRNDRYVEVLVDQLQSHPGAALAYGDLVMFSGDDDPAAIAPTVLDFDWTGRSRYRQIENMMYRKHAAIYGLLRTKFLKEFSWRETDFGSDVALLLYLRLRGEFVHAPGAVFYEWIVTKSPADRARTEANRPLSRFWLARLSLLCGSVASEAARRDGGRPRFLSTALLSYVVLRKDRLKVWLYRGSPTVLKRLWQRRRAVPARSTGPAT
jgi:glycosyltransferase involved in cell wall biosynthesis